MSLSNAVVVAPGGVGTLLELLYTWQLMQVEHICHIPIILVGRQWPPFLRWVEKYPLGSKYISKKDMTSLFVVKDYKEAMNIIDETYKKHQQGDKNFCLNYKKYKIK